MLLQNKKTAIIGAGPGGLILGKLLQTAGADVKIYERDTNKDVRQQGATLDLHEESGLEAIRRAGLMDEFISHHRPDAGKMRILDSDGLIRLDDHESASPLHEDRPEIDRAVLRELIINSLDAGTIVWDSHFTSMSPSGDGWQLNFKNGTTAYADLVVAADGAHSKIRSYITPVQPVYSGISIVEGNIYNAAKNAPKLWALVKGGKIFALGQEQSIILSAKGEGSLSFYTGCKVEEGWAQDSGIDFTDKRQVLAWFEAAYKSWSPQWLELFASDDIWFVPRPQYHFPLDQDWAAMPNLTMLGDAAHRMPPYAGEGVNQAMQDAFELAEALCHGDGDNLREAIGGYERRMRQRAAEITKITLENTELMHSDTGLDRILALFNGFQNG